MSYSTVSIEGVPGAFKDAFTQACERVIPMFWEAFYEHHGDRFGPFNPNGPVGHLHAFQVYQAMAETVEKYVKDHAK